MARREASRDAGALLLLGAVLLLGMRRPAAPPPPEEEGAAAFGIGPQGSFTVDGSRAALGQQARPISIRLGQRWSVQWPVTHVGRGGTFPAAFILAPGGLTHWDPVTLPPETWHWVTFTVPDHVQPTPITVSGGPFLIDTALNALARVLPAGVPDGQTLDVNFAIFPAGASGADRAGAYRNRFDDDWDDDVFRVSLLAPTSFSIATEGSVVSVAQARPARGLAFREAGLWPRVGVNPTLPGTVVAVRQELLAPARRQPVV